MRRFLIAMTVMVALLVASRIYSAILTPMTTLVVSPAIGQSGDEQAIRPPALFEKEAMEVFPEAPWTHHAEHAMQMGESVSLYCRQYSRVPNSGNKIQVSPVAIVWRDPRRPGSQPYRMLAQSAQLKFQNSFFGDAISLNAKPGRIVWASLEGAVHIDGPDGLQINGQNFKFEEESLKLYSDFPIEFAYGPTATDQRKTAGSAREIELNFLPSSDAVLGRDMPRIAGLAQLLLRRNVVVDSHFLQGGQPRHVRLTSDGSLEYDAVKAECTIDDHVKVTHQQTKNGKSLLDSIACEWIQLKFLAKNTPQDNKGGPKPPSLEGMALQTIQALGSSNGKGTRLKLVSEDQDITADMQDLFYHVVQRKGIFLDQEHVVVQRGQTRFLSPEITLQHSEKNTLEYLRCQGPGQMEVYEERFGNLPMMARWASGVEVLPDPEAKTHQVQIKKQAQLSVPNQFALACDLLQLWVDLDRLSTQPQQGQKSAGGNSLQRPLPLKRALAEGHVLVDSPLLKVTRSNLVDAIISPGVLGAKEAGAGSPFGSSGNEATRNKQQNPWVVEADHLRLDLVHDSLHGAMDFRQIDGAGKIRIEHQPDQPISTGSTKMSGPIVVEAAFLRAENQGGTRQVLTLDGKFDEYEKLVTPASVSLGEANLWGGQIRVTRDENRIDIPGKGGLEVPIPKRASVENSKPQMLSIIWDERMKFDGSEVTFWGKTTTNLKGEDGNVSRLLCEELSARLNQKVSFAEPQKNQGEINFDLISAKHKVSLESVEFKQTSLVSQHRAFLATFVLNQTTGEFSGQGPGEIHSWTLGDQMRIAPGETPRANQPATAKPSEAKWRYSGVSFAGKIEGNMNRSEATLNDRVQIITAPVAEAQIKFSRNSISQDTPEARNAVWMKCDQLRILQKMVANQKSGLVEVFAIGASELEGHVFYAYADELTYDQASGQFVLRGLGRDATLYYQPRLDQPARPSSHRQIQFTPAEQKISFDGSTGFSGSN